MYFANIHGKILKEILSLLIELFRIFIAIFSLRFYPFCV